MSTFLSGEQPVNVININKYIPVLSCNQEATKKSQEDGGTPLEDAIQNALSAAKTVLVVGCEGSGKTTALEKLFMDWSKGEQLKAFTHIVYFRLSELNLLEEPISFTTLLQHSRLPPAEEITQPDKVLFIFDELDLYRHTLDPSVYSLCSDPNQITTVPSLVASVLNGSLMSGAYCLVASRTTTNLLSGLQIEVLGFLKPQREVFFKSFFSDTAVATNALQHMEATLGFYSFSTCPRFCWTVCCVYKVLIDSGKELPNTLTQLFVCILVHLFQKITPNDEIQKNALALGKLAYYSSLGQHSTFTKDNIISSGLTFQFPFDNFLRVAGDRELDKAAFSWNSKLMEEFMLTVYFFINPDSESLEKMVETPKNRKTFVDAFMSGLSEPVHRRPLEELLGPFNSIQILHFKNWLKNRCEKTLPGCQKKEHCHCFHLLYQTQNKDVVKELITPSARLGISYGDLSLQDYVALNYVVTQLGEVELLNLYHTKHFTKEMAKILTPAMSVSQKISLIQCRIGNEVVDCLVTALREGITKDLNLHSSSLNEAQFKSLCIGLSNSKVHSINLHNCGLTADSCEHLAPALSSATSQLCSLDLSGNEIGDQGLKTLCQGLQSPHCRLQYMVLRFCHLTSASIEDLSRSLGSGHSDLKNIILSNNEVGDVGVEALCKALKHPQCKLQSLILFDCWLTEACCPHLMDALMSDHCTLKELDLGVNDLGQEGALMLCRAFKRPGCQLEKLRLSRCELTEVVFGELASLLKSGTPPLKSLDLGVNRVGDQGVKHLFDAMRHPSCVLEELDVDLTDLTDACVEDLCAAIRASNTLKRLELPNNSLTNASIPALIKVMQDSPHMEELNVKYNEFSDELFELFAVCDKIRF